MRMTVVTFLRLDLNNFRSVSLLCGSLADLNAKPMIALLNFEVRTVRAQKMNSVYQHEMKSVGDYSNSFQLANILSKTLQGGPQRA